MAKKKASGKKAKDQVEEKEDAAAEEPEKKRQVPIERSEEHVRYDFSDEELIKLGESMAELISRVERLKAEKKSAAADFDSDIKKVELDLQSVVRSIRDKFEMRNAECFIVKDFKNRKAYVFRSDQMDLETLQTWDGEKLFELIEAGSLGADPVKIKQISSRELQKELEFGEKSEGDDSGGGGDPGGPPGGEVDSEGLVDEELEEQTA